MKSIKEKAEELSIAFRKEQGDVGYSEQLSYKLGIDAGANYVLGEIEKVVQGDLDFQSAFKLRCIKQIIEHLKSNK